MHEFLENAGALPLRDYVPAAEGAIRSRCLSGSFKGQMVRAEPDDDINYTVLALQLRRSMVWSSTRSM